MAANPSGKPAVAASAAPATGDDAVKEVKKPAPVDRLVRAAEKARFSGSEYSRTIHCYKAFPGVTPQDLLNPSHWVHVATNIKQFDRIEALADDGTWWAEYMVIASGRTYAQLHLLREHALTKFDMGGSESTIFTEYDITHRGTHCQWSVVRKSDREVVHEFSQTFDAAQTWLKGHLAALGR